MTLSKQITSALLAVTAGSGIGLTTALAQPPAAPATAGASQLAPAKTGRENLTRLQKVITVDMKEWKLEEFVATMRTGVDPSGHELSKQMPWQSIGRMSDEELRAVYEYLTRLPNP